MGVGPENLYIPIVRHDHSLIRKVVELTASMTYSQIAAHLGLASRSVVAGIVRRATTGDYSNTMLLGAQAAREARRVQTEDGRKARREMLALRRSEFDKLQAQKRAEAALRKAEREADAQRRKAMSLARKPPAHGMTWAEREARRAMADKIAIRNVPFLAVKAGECRWPTADRPMRFCALPALPNKPYCDCHHAVAYKGFQK